MIFGSTEYSKQELFRRSAGLSTLYHARRMTLTEGFSSGHRVIEVKTAAGLQLLLSQDRCLDILELSYRSMNMGFLSKNGITSNTYADTYAPAFKKFWSGGLLSTCGLRNTGGDCTCDGEYFPMHGRIGATPADHVSVVYEQDSMVITGTMFESALFGSNLEMRRRIEIPNDGACIHIRDEIFNHTPTDEPLFLLYHYNFGFPFLDEGLKIDFPVGEVIPRTPYAAQNIDHYAHISAPIDHQEEQVFFHIASSAGKNKVKLTNERLGIGATLSYDRESLPILTQWKSMGSGDYALGIEPGTSMLRGRKEELEKDYGVKINAFCSKAFETSLDFFECIED